MIAPLNRDRTEARSRTRWAMGTSVLVHAMLLMWLVFVPSPDAEGEVITEITFLTDDELAAMTPASPAPVSKGEETVSGNPGQAIPGPSTPGIGAKPEEERFARDEDADVVVRPQSDIAIADRLEARLAKLDRKSPAPVGASVASAVELPGLWKSRAGRPDGSPLSTAAPPIALRREGGQESGNAPLALTRGSAPTSGRPLRMAALPETKADAPAEPEAGGSPNSMRTLAGASLLGPIADRPIASYVAAVYPEWAKREGIEASVTLYFVVRSDGTIKENIVVEKTAGFEEFDDSARAALRAWRFKPLSAGRTGEQWGRITFHFRLTDAH